MELFRSRRSPIFSIYLNNITEILWDFTFLCWDGPNNWLCKRSLEVYSYSKLLRGYVSRRSGNAIDEVGVRQRSANLITRTDVDAVDHWLIEQVRLNRADQHIIIDSHPVIKEDYGFRVTAFSPEQLQDLNQDAIVCLYVAPTSPESASQQMQPVGHSYRF